MTLATTARPAPFGAIATYAAIGFVSSVVEGFVEWKVQRKTLRELSALTDHQLADIGMTRADINNGSIRF